MNDNLPQVFIIIIRTNSDGNKRNILPSHPILCLVLPLGSLGAMG